MKTLELILGLVVDTVRATFVLAGVSSVAAIALAVYNPAFKLQLIQWITMIK